MFTPKSSGVSTPTNLAGSGGPGDRSYASASARAIATAAARRRSTGVGLFSSASKRSPFGTSGRTTPLNRSLQTSQITENGTGQYTIESYGSSLPALVMEALTFADRNAELSAVLASSGWTWLVAGRRLLIWKYRADGSRRIVNQQFRELTLPSSDLAHRAQLVAVYSQTEGQVPSCIAVSPEGFVRYWNNISHESSYVEVSTDLQGQECHNLLFMGSSLGCCLSTTTSTILQIQPVSGAGAGTHINVHHLKAPSGILGGISRRVSSLVFGSMPSQAPEARLVGVVCLDTITGDTDERNVIVLSAKSLQKWNFRPGQPEKLLYECDVDKIIHDALTNLVWGRDRVGNLQTWLISVQSVGGTGSIMILTAAVNSQISQQLVYSLVTLDTSGPNPPQNVPSFCMLKHSEYYQESSETTILAQKFLLFGSTAFIYSKNSVLCVPATTVADSEGVDRLEFSSAGDGILGVGRTQSYPLFFSANHGIVSVTQSGINQSSMSVNETTLNETLDLTNMTLLGTDCNNMTDVFSQLQIAFLQFNRKNIIQAQTILEGLFPNGEDAGLDKAVVQLSTRLLDDIPASDPRWAQANQSAALNASSTTSLIIANQIKDKIVAHQYFISFLQKMGLWQRLGTTLIDNQRRVPVRILLAEHCELLHVISDLKTLHQTHQALTDAAIRFVLSERGESPTGQLSNSDIFYRKISKVDTVFWGYLQAQDEVLSADISPQDASMTIFNVNSILISLLKTAKETKFSSASIMGTRTLHAEAQVEYVPWYSSEGPLGIRQILTKQHGITVETGLTRAEDGGVRGSLYSHLVDLTDEILGGFQPHLASLAAVSHPRHETLVEDYQRLRYSLLQPLVKEEQYNQAIAIAEKFCDFRTLVEVCEKTDNQDRLNQYMAQFGSQGFSDFVFRWYLETGKRGKLLSQGSSEKARDDLTRFLQDYSSLAWLHQINSRDFDSAHKTLKELAHQETSYHSRKKTLLSLSKLCGIAACETNAAHEEIDPRILLEEDLILYQEQLPERVLNAHSVSHDTMRVFSPKELIHLYVSEDNVCSNELDFKKALDLLNWIDDPSEVEELKRMIWVRAILRDAWTHLDTDSPIEAMKETVFFRTVVLAHTQGSNLKELLVPVDVLLNSEELETLKEDKAFEFLVRAGYERVNEYSG